MNNLSENQKHQICQRAVETKKDIEFKFLELGELLHQIRENNYFEAGWDSWEDYAQELKMSLASISKLIRIYQVFVLKYEFSPAKIATVGWSSLAELLPDVQETTPKSEVSAWLGEATELSRSDLRRTITERRKGTDMKTCKHEEAYKLWCCPDCGERRKL